MTNKEMREQAIERIYKFLRYIYGMRRFNYSKAVKSFEATSQRVPYQSPLRVILRRMNLIGSLSSGNYRWAADFPSIKMAQEVYTSCLKGYQKPVTERAKEIKEAVKELVGEDIYALENPRDVAVNLCGMEMVKESAIREAKGEERTFVLYKRIGTITIAQVININYD